MCGSCCMPGGFRCNGRAGCWPGPTLRHKTAGTAASIPRKKKSQARHWALIFTDEASFRQDSTLHATWSRVGRSPEVPVTGERKNVKVFGAIELWHTRFHYAQDTVFNASTYGTFLERLGRHYRRGGAMLIQDTFRITKIKM